MSTLLGYKWISSQTGITPVQPFSVQSELGTTRRTVVTGEMRHETYPASQRPEQTIHGRVGDRRRQAGAGRRGG